MNRLSDTFKLVSGEPYRVFFPVALLAGVIGVLLWPLFYWGKLAYYPSFAHARLMIEGFVGGFAIGFLGTALPKMLSAAPLRVWQVGLMLLMYLGYCGLHVAGEIRLGDGVFAATMLLMVILVMIRVIKGNTVPPPGMLLTGLGLVCAILGAAWMAAFGLTGDVAWSIFFQRLLYQAFILLPLLGVGGFIFPMILGTTNKHARLGGAKISQGWRLKAGEGVLLGLLLIVTYWVEGRMLAANAGDHVRFMTLTRFLLCTVWVTKESGWLTRPKAKGVMSFALRAGIFCLLGGLVASIFYQEKRIALEHTLYIGGFGLITMIVATRVIYGHSGQGAMFQKWLKPVILCTGLLLLGMATRVSADFMPKIMMTHHIYAAGCWVVVSIIWGVAVLPSVRKRPFPVFAAPKPKPGKRSVLRMDFRNKD